MKRSLFSITGILLLTVILVFANGIASFSLSRFKLDLTEEGLFSLSDGTRNILAGMEEEITLRFYASRPDDMHPALKVYAKRIEDLLREYKRYSKGKLNLEVYDPEPDTDAEDWAKKYGLTPFALPGKSPIFLGLVGVNAVGDEDVIAFFQPDRQQFVEYDLSKLIYNLQGAAKPKIAVISSVELEGKQVPPSPFPQMPQAEVSSEPWYFLKQLQALGDLKVLSKDVDKIDEEVKLLMLIHPIGLSEKTLFAIDQYVVSGGNLFVAIDPNCQSCAPQQAAYPPKSENDPATASNLDALLQKWGVEMTSGKVVGNRDLAAKVAVSQSDVKDFLLWLAFNKGSKDEGLVNKTEVVTSELDSLIFPWSGNLSVKEQKGLDVSVLLKTSANSKLYDSAAFSSLNVNPDQLLKDFSSENTEHVIALRLNSKFKSNFSKTPAGSSLPYAAGGNKSSSIFVVSDVDFMADMYSIAKQQFFNTEIVSLINDNILFLQNVVENLLGSSDLISLRSRGSFSRPFSRVDEIERKAQERWLDEESSLQEELDKINARLGELLQAQGAEKGGKVVVNQAILSEIKQFREQQKEAKQRLREVRRKSREDIESMESRLFLLNTFLIPALLVLFSMLLAFYRARKK